MINAHGGKLVNRVKDVDPSGLMSIDISADLANDVENIADGIFSPLEGFLNQQDFESVISKGRLANGMAWTMPTVLDVDEETGKKMKDAGDVLLKNPDGTGIAVLHVEDVYSYDKQATMNGVYGTNDESHPGVSKTNSMKDFLWETRWNHDNPCGEGKARNEVSNYQLRIKSVGQSMELAEAVQQHQMTQQSLIP